MKYNFRADFSDAQAALTRFGKSQIPFATTLALTRLAQGVRDVENAETVKTFKNPTPFTRKSFTIERATKTTQRAIVRPKDVQEHYLEPYVFGGDRYLGSKRKQLVPVEQRTNQYGKLTPGTLARLKGKPNVFVGAVKMKDGRSIYGVWQRQGGSTGARGRNGMAQPQHLKLLIAFKPTTPAPFEFPFFEDADQYLRKNAMAVFRQALADAMRTSKRT